MRRHPGNRRLRHADAFGVGDLAQRFDQGEVRIDVITLEARAERPEIATGGGALLPVAADETTREHAVGRDGDAAFADHGQDRLLDAAGDQRILDLQVADRVDSRSAPDRLDADLREADVADIAGLHHVGDRPHRLLDRHARIKPRRPVDIDVVKPQALQRIGEKALHRRRPPVISQPAAGRIAQRTEFHADDHLLARRPFERLGDQHLVVAHAVEIAGVDERDAGVERGPDGGDALVPIRRAIQARHAHTAEAEGGDGRSVGAEAAILHVMFSKSWGPGVRRRDGRRNTGWCRVR